jgi:hypothetical protein
LERANIYKQRKDIQVIRDLIIIHTLNIIHFVIGCIHRMLTDGTTIFPFS